MGAEAESNLINRRCTKDIVSEDLIKKSSSSDEEIEQKDVYDKVTLKNSINTMKSKLDLEVPLDSNGEIVGNGLASTEPSKIPSSGLLLPSQIGTDFTFKRQIVWFNAIGFLFLHIAGLIGLILMFTYIADIRTTLYFMFLIFASGMGVTMGAHRLFSHRSFKTKPWLRVLLILMHTLAGQNCLYVWVRDHRQHHKYSDTDADPHNASRGFFFSHCGWLMSKKHPKVIEYGKKIDMSDMEADPWIMFQKKYYKTLYTIFTILIPTAIPIYFWNENVLIALFSTYFSRTVVQLNFTWSVNSIAHLFGNKPYDKTMLPVESPFVALVAGGEGWHNYHHTFPWDYRAAELGMPLNLTTKIIDFAAQYGAVYDRRFASNNMIKSRCERTGDGTHQIYGHSHHHDHEEVDETEACIMEKNDDHALRKYIVGKQQVNKLMMDRLEKYIKDDDFNNNISHNTDKPTNSDKPTTIDSTSTSNATNITNSNSCNKTCNSETSNKLICFKELDKFSKLIIEPKDKRALNICAN